MAEVGVNKSQARAHKGDFGDRVTHNASRNGHGGHPAKLRPGLAKHCYSAHKENNGQ